MAFLRNVLSRVEVPVAVQAATWVIPNSAKNIGKLIRDGIEYTDRIVSIPTHSCLRSA
jgi:hypothetical protein